MLAQGGGTARCLPPRVQGDQHALRRVHLHSQGAAQTPSSGVRRTRTLTDHRGVADGLLLPDIQGQGHASHAVHHHHLHQPPPLPAKTEKGGVANNLLLLSLQHGGGGAAGGQLRHVNHVVHHHRLHQLPALSSQIEKDGLEDGVLLPNVECEGEGAAGGQRQVEQHGGAEPENSGQLLHHHQQAPVCATSLGEGGAVSRPTRAAGECQGDSHTLNMVQEVIKLKEQTIKICSQQQLNL